MVTRKSAKNSIRSYLNTYTQYVWFIRIVATILYSFDLAFLDPERQAKGFHKITFLIRVQPSYPSHKISQIVRFSQMTIGWRHMAQRCFKSYTIPLKSVRGAW